MKLTVVIPTRNRSSNLRNTVNALVNQTLNKDEYEIIISDDNSTDDTFSVYKEIQDKVKAKYVNNNTKPHTWNASIPRNLGASISSQESEALIFVDSDVLLPGNALELFLEDYNANPNRIVVGPYDFMAKDGENIMTPEVRMQKFNEVDVSETFNKVTDGLALFGGNIMIPKKIFYDLSGYDPQTHCGLEDGEFGLRAWKASIDISYDKRIHGKHQWHETPTDRFPPNLKSEHIDKLNLKHFKTKEPDYGIVEASRETYKEWGINDWREPEEWRRIGFTLNFNEKKK